eukprot:4230702-Pyramimonas_sp.AAC.1
MRSHGYCFGGRSLALARCLLTVCGTATQTMPLVMQHVPNHEGMPWNELVDGLSKRARCLEEKSEWVHQLPLNYKDIVRDNKYYQWEAI